MQRFKSQMSSYPSEWSSFSRVSSSCFCSARHSFLTLSISEIVHSLPCTKCNTKRSVSIVFIGFGASVIDGQVLWDRHVLEFISEAHRRSITPMLPSSPGCLRILASKAVPRGCNPDVCDPKIYSCNTTCWHGVSLQSSHIYRNIYIVEHILYSIYWDNKSDHKEIHHRDSAKNFTLNSTSNMRCNLTGDIAYVHVCKYMSLDPLDAPPPFNSGDWRLIGIPCLKMKSSNLVETVTGRRGTSQNTSTLSECPDHEMGHFWRQHDLSLSLGELPNNLGQPGELRWSLGSLRSQWPQESSLKVMPFPGKTIKKTISAKRDNPIYGVNWIVLWP